MKEKRMTSKNVTELLLKLKAWFCFPWYFRPSKPKSELTLLSRSDVNDKRPWTKSGQTPVLYVKFYWNTETFICLYIIYGSFHMTPKAVLLLLFDSLRKFCLLPNLEGPDIVLICHAHNHNIQTNSLYFS